MPKTCERGESVGAVVMARLKRLPRVGDKVDLGGMPPR